MKEEINSAIKEFVPLYEDVTTSDLQGICMARASQIIRNNNGNKKPDVMEVMEISGEILEGIYETIEGGEQNAKN